MKVFIIALILLLSLILSAFVFSHILISEIDAITKEAESLRQLQPSEWERGANQVKKTWEAKRPLFSMTINHTESDRVEDVFAQLQGAAKTSGDDFLIAAEELISALSHIRDLCATTPEMVF